MPFFFSFAQFPGSSMKTKRKTVGKSFKAALERMGHSRLNWVIGRIPFDVAKVWGVRGRLRVKGEINGFPFRTALFPTGKGYHFLLVNKRMQAGGDVRPGGTAHFCLEPDLEIRKAVVPVELKRFLSQDRALSSWFENLTYSIRKWIGDSITQPKSTDARLRRAEQIAERLLTAMEAERDLPPVLRAAFARDPRAYEGWQRMSPTQRRHQLLGIFYYRSPEARDRRIAKMLEEAAARASNVARGKPA